MLAKQLVRAVARLPAPEMTLRAMSAAAAKPKPVKAAKVAPTEEAMPWKPSPLTPGKMLYERSAEECWKNLAHLTSTGLLTRAGIYDRLLIKYGQGCWAVAAA